MNLFRPGLPRLNRELCLIALLAGSFLLSPGQRAIASTLSGSWYLVDSNKSGYPSGNNYAQVTISVDSSDKATFNVSLLPVLAGSGYLSQSFGFNWTGSSDISSPISTALANAASPLNNWTVAGASGSPNQSMDGMGKYNYQISAQGNNDRTDPVSFTMDLSGLGLSQSDIFNDFQVTSSGSHGSGYFALHVAGPCNTFYLGGSDPVPTPTPRPEPSSLISMGIAAGLLLCVTCLRFSVLPSLCTRWRNA